MRRREFVASVLASGLAAPAIGGEHDDHKPISGPLSHAVVAFGAWRTDPALDRFPDVPPAPAANAHFLFPHDVTIRAGGAVSFVISGLHNVQVFGPGKRPQDVDITSPVGMTGPPPLTGLPIINDSAKRIYRGPDPSLMPLDRVEVVHFAKPGRYLVICGFLFHFQDDMFGWVRVLPPRHDD